MFFVSLKKKLRATSCSGAGDTRTIARVQSIGSAAYKMYVCLKEHSSKELRIEERQITRQAMPLVTLTHRGGTQFIRRLVT